MKTEISRDSHQPSKRYSGVYQQQGRMLTDADWNELVDILKERMNDALKDVVGNQLGSKGGTPRHRALRILNVTSTEVSIQPGHVYIDGVAAHITGENPITYAQQLDLPAPIATPTSGSYFLYADLWERTVTQLMDERLLDKGLHGADTCSRKQMMAQVKWCTNSIDPEKSDTNPQKGNARLSATLLNKTAQPDPCDPCADTVDVDSNVGNYLFRVEVHDVKGQANRPEEVTIKWSSENGAEQFSANPQANMPAGFVDNKYVYEFFNETSEKHAGVHLARDANFPQREDLYQVYPDTLPAGFDYVRRWDGYVIFQWDVLNKSWTLHDGVSADIQVIEDSLSTRADKVLKLEAVEIRLQLLSRELSGPVSEAVLAAGNLNINTLDVAPLAIVSDTISTKENQASAITKAEVINQAFGAVTDESKVWATVNGTLVEGITPTLLTELASGDLTINDKIIDAISATDDQSVQADAIKNAINKAFPGEDIVAIKTIANALKLTAADGRNIDIALNGSNTEQKCGLSAGTYYGNLVLSSRSFIHIGGSNPAVVGLNSGITPALQTVAGDYWLVDVREAEHQAGSVLIRDRAPQGIEHYYLRLAEVDDKGQLLVNPEAHRKYAFPSLTEMTHMFRVRGNGQEAMPGEQLDHPLVVGVVNGEWPVEGAQVAFLLEDGSGSISSSGSIDFPSKGVIVSTNKFGLAICDWVLGPLNSGAQRVVTRLVDPDSDIPKSVNFLKHPSINFTANLSTADRVAYDSECDSTTADTVHHLLVNKPPAVLNQQNPDYYTVKEILDALLCKLRARHIPYDPTNVARWDDINLEEESAASPPETVQDAIDDLLENLHSEDIKYPLPKCSSNSNTLKGYLEADIANKESDGTTEYARIRDLWDALLCHLDAAKLPYNPNLSAATIDRWRIILGQLGSGDLSEPNTVQEAIDEIINIDATKIAVDRNTLCARLEALGGGDTVDTVQDAINALCNTNQGGCCEITISPGDDIEARLTSEIRKNANAHICISEGEYNVKNPIILEDLGHITIQGCGNGTIIRAVKSEIAVKLNRCKSVIVRNCTLQSYQLSNEHKTLEAHLNGVLTINDVEDVVVHDVTITCAHGGIRMSSCLTVAQSTQDASVRVNDCHLNPGHQQVGMLLINANLARIEDNQVKVRQKSNNSSLKTLLKDQYYRLTIRKIMLADMVVVEKNAQADKQRNVEFGYEGRLLRFRAEKLLVKDWLGYLAKLELKKDLSNRDLIRFMKDHADNILLSLADPKRTAPSNNISIFKDWFEKMKSDLPSIASQGIVCGGRIANDICITKNSIYGVSQGIHIGLSHNDAGEKEPDHATRLLITGNRIVNYLSSQELGEKHGVFVGNFECLHIENNYLKLKKFPTNLEYQVTGIRLFGYFGGMLQLRGNSLNGYETGIFAKAIGAEKADIRLWQVENNLLQGSNVEPVLVPQGAFLASNNPH